MKLVCKLLSVNLNQIYWLPIEIHFYLRKYHKKVM